MTPERYRLIRSCFEATLEHEPAFRATFARETYRDDPDLVAHILELLAAYETENVIDAPPTLDDTRAWSEGEDLTGTQLGSYQVESLLGRGGMGSVYLAKRFDGTFERRVAIKVARPGFLHETLAHRIRTEQKILAELEHSNIAKLLDAGTTATGSPFFVMEYIEGLPLTVYCGRNSLTLPQRIRLFSNRLRSCIVCTSATDRSS